MKINWAAGLLERLGVGSDVEPAHYCSPKRVLSRQQAKATERRHARNKVARRSRQVNRRRAR